jgi:hypothetical protein
MANCGQACPYNTLDGCKVKEYNAICPLTNMATPITEYRMTNADRIRAMSDEELAKVPMQWGGYPCVFPERVCGNGHTCKKCLLEWLQQPAEESAS